MKKIFLRAICFLVAASILLVFTSCKDSDNNEEPTGDLWEEFPGFTDVEIDYEGKDFRIMVYGSWDKPESGSQKENIHLKWAERNNVGSFVWDTVADWGAFQSKLTAEVLSNSAPDIVLMPMYWYFPAVINDLVHEIPNAQKFVDESSLFVDKVSLGYYDNGKYYGLLDDSYIANTEGIVYNKALMKKYALEDPAKLFLEDKWDWETFFRYVEAISEDTNRDGMADVFGYACPGLMDGRADVTNFVAANGGDMIVGNSNNRFSIGFGTTNAIEALDFIKRIGFDNEYSSIELNMDFTRVMGLFTSGNIGLMGMCAWGVGYGQEFPAGFTGYPKGPSAGDNYKLWNVSGMMISSPKSTANPEQALKIYEGLRLSNYILSSLDQTGEYLDSDIVEDMVYQLSLPESKGKLALMESSLQSWGGIEPDEYTIPAIRKVIESNVFSPLEGINDFRHYAKSVIGDILFGVNDGRNSVEQHNPVWQEFLDVNLNSVLDSFENK